VSRSSPVSAPRSALPPPAELGARLSPSPLLIALDIDGTIAPIAPTPDKAAVPDETRETLERLTRLPNVHVAFVTGRAAADGRRLVGVPKSWTIGNHGLELIDSRGELRVDPAAGEFATLLERAVRLLHEPLRRYEGVFIEDKRWTLSIHFRLAPESDVPNVERVVAEVARELGLHLLEGKKILELRPPLAINKGTALVELATRLGVFQEGILRGSILYVGDDRTDEDAFLALPRPPANAITLHVGKSSLPEGLRTNAEFVVRDTVAVQELLKWLLSVRASVSAPLA